MVILDANMYDQHHIDKKSINVKNPRVKISEVWCHWLGFLSMNLDPSVPVGQFWTSWYFCRTSVIWIMAAGKLQRRRSAPDRFSDSVSLEEYD